MERAERIELALRVCFAGILVGGGAAAYTACFCGGCGGCPNLPPPQDFSVTFTTACSTGDAAAEASAEDASSDALASDASDDASDGEAGVPCFASCNEACQALAPATAIGSAFCLSSDAGAGGLTVASCRSQEVCVGGRKFDGIDAPAIAGESVGAWLARMAWLEAASIPAFRRLARELAAHGAPRALVARARDAARDEIRHARLMARLAKKHGVAVPRVSLPSPQTRDLESIARENAVEGCVAETFGALYAAWQATQERDPEIAQAMAEIAPDELRHAALGWAVAEWLDSKLDAAARERVRAARTDAARELIANVSSASERRLADGLMQQLWAA